MDKDKLKIELLQKIIACDDVYVLTKVEDILDSSASEISEVGESYFSGKNEKPESVVGSNLKDRKNLNISPKQEEELMRRVADHSNGTGKTFSWEETKKNIRNIEG